MLESLIHIDQELFLRLNAWHSDFFDPIMWIISGKYTFIPLYLAVAAWLIVRYRVRGAILIGLGILVFALSDQLSVHAFKQTIQRLRPCHEPGISETVHLVRNHCGGLYGFVSSHASNTFSFALFTTLALKKRWYGIFIFLWAALVSYSRIYLGQHYPGDILGGAVLGLLIAWLVYRGYMVISRGQKPEARNQKHYLYLF